MTSLQDIVGDIGSPKQKTKQNTSLTDFTKQDRLTVKKKQETELAIVQEEKQLQTFDKIVLCLSRSLTFNEMVLLNRMFSVLVFKSEFHADKKAEKLLFELLILDFTNKKHLSWYLTNKDYLKSQCNVINLALSKKGLDADAITRLKKTFSFDSVIKKIDDEFISSGAELLCQMLVDHCPLPQNSICDKVYKLCQPSSKKKK